MKAILQVTAAAADILADVFAAGAGATGAEGVIVLTGCGTSGRIAFLTARTFNSVLATLGLPKIFRYLVSGGDPALLLSDELPEVRRVRSPGVPPWLHRFALRRRNLCRRVVDSGKSARVCVHLYVYRGGAW